MENFQERIPTMSDIILTNEMKDVPCWCGETKPYYAPIRRGCGGHGYVTCICGGDFCVCHNHGEVECLGCKDCESDDEDDL